MQCTLGYLKFRQISQSLIMKHLHVSLSKPELVLNPYTGTSGVYSACFPELQSKSTIGAICDKLGVGYYPDETHCTMMYSKEKTLSDPKYAECNPAKPFWCLITHVEHWTGHDGKTYIVAALSSPALIMEHARLRRLGAQHSFTPYKPHITLSSDVAVNEEMQVKIDRLNASLSVDPQMVILTGQKIVDVKMS